MSEEATPTDQTNGIYYVTLHVQNGRPPLGHISDGRIELTPLGQLAATCWQLLAEKHPAIHLDAFVIMPNHLHGLIFIGRTPPAVGTGFMGSGFGGSPVADSGRSAATPTIDEIIQTYKTTCAAERKAQNYPNEALWDHHEQWRKVQNEKALNALRHAIYKNPANWHKDPLNTEHPPHH